MCNFGARKDSRNGRIAISSYSDVDTRKYQCRMLNPTPLECISGYIMEDDVVDRALKSLYHKSLNLIDGSISSY